MNRPYEVFLRSEAIDAMRGIRGGLRRQVSAFIDSLALDPFSEGDYAVKDPSGRVIRIKVLGRYAVTFWADHPVKEVRILDIRFADRA